MLRKLLIFHALITLAAALVLVFAPTLIPGTVHIDMHKDQFLLCYFLAAAELAIAYLSFGSRNITDLVLLRLVVATIIIFHAATALLELLALINGASTNLLANVVARILIIGLFYSYGVVKVRPRQ